MRMSSRRFSVTGLYSASHAFFSGVIRCAGTVTCGACARLRQGSRKRAVRQQSRPRQGAVCTKRRSSDGAPTRLQVAPAPQRSAATQAESAGAYPPEFHAPPALVERAQRRKAGPVRRARRGRLPAARAGVPRRLTAAAGGLARGGAARAAGLAAGARLCVQRLVRTAVHWQRRRRGERRASLGARLLLADLWHPGGGGDRGGLPLLETGALVPGKAATREDARRRAIANRELERSWEPDGLFSE